MISDDDRATIVARYAARFEEFGIDIRTLNAGKANKLEIQHTVHASIGDLNNKTILDIGCGLGSYYEFLLSRGVRVKYIGLIPTRSRIRWSTGRPGSRAS